MRRPAGSRVWTRPCVRGGTGTRDPSRLDGGAGSTGTSGDGGRGTRLQYNELLELHLKALLPLLQCMVCLRFLDPSEFSLGRKPPRKLASQAQCKHCVAVWGGDCRGEGPQQVEQVPRALHHMTCFERVVSRNRGRRQPSVVRQLQNAPNFLAGLRLGV